MFVTERSAEHEDEGAELHETIEVEEHTPPHQGAGQRVPWHIEAPSVPLHTPVRKRVMPLPSSGVAESSGLGSRRRAFPAHDIFMVGISLSGL